LRLPRPSAAAAPTAAVIRREAEHAAGRLPPLMVQADRIAATVAQGVHGRRRVGQGDTFWQFRHYQTGDAATAIDWRQSAKSQSAFVRENEWDAAQSVWLWCDASPSMRYRSSEETPEKAERAAVLTLALAALLIRGGERTGVLGAGFAPSNSRASINRIADHLSRLQVTDASLPPVEPLPRYARLVMFGDMLSPIEELEPIIRGFAGMGVEGHVVQVNDIVEETLPFRGRIRFDGLEGEGSALIGRVEMVRDDYVALMDSHRRALGDIARSVGWTFAVHHTDRPPQTPLLALYGALSERAM
jgi:uncharacterized protein (DUF58 family)